MTMKKIAVIKELSLGKKEMGDRRVESGSEIMCILDAIEVFYLLLYSLLLLMTSSQHTHTPLTVHNAVSQ
jgi:hypothetical protein